MRLICIAAFGLLSAPVLAQPAQEPRHTINVSGHGTVKVPPDTARIHYWVRGEGKTPDEASRAMAESQARVEKGLKDFLGTGTAITNSDLIVMEVRDTRCKDQNQPQLSQGDCAIVGYMARLEGDVTTPRIDKAGTAVGLAGRYGARDTRLQSFDLRDTAEARRDAIRKAVADARDQAQILAAAAGGHVGPALTISYGSYGMPVVVSGARAFAPSAPPPPPPAPPVEINLNPQPQEISADVSMSFALLP